MHKSRVAAIIPAFNEEETIVDVVRVVRESSFITEVIVVSDGSTDRTAELAEGAGAHVLNLPIQNGKGPAMQHGVTFTDAPIIIFLDADLRGLTPMHIEQLVVPVLNGSCMMNVGIRDRGKVSRMIGPHLPLVSGERALHRTIFERVPDEHIRGYMVEVSLNFACRSQKLKYGTVFMKGVTIRTKVDKVGAVKAFFQYIKMWFQVAKAVVVVRAAYAKDKIPILEL